MSDDRIIEQIKKLLALSDTSRGATIEEAATAAAKVQTLLFKHNLTMAEVQAVNSDDDGYEMTTTALRGVGREWRRTLLHVIAQANFCRSIGIIGAPWSKLIGKPCNIEIVEYLYAYLVREVWSCWKRRAKQFRKRSRARYCKGCVMAIAVTLEEQRRQDEDAGDTCRALVIRVDQALDAAKDRLAGPTVRHKPRKDRSRSKAIDVGYADGLAIEIRTGLESGAAAPLLEQAS